MRHFSVEPAELIQLAKHAGDRRAELVGMAAAKYTLNACELDVAELVEPLNAVQAGSAHAMKIISDDLDALAERLGATAAGYQEVDVTLARRFAALASALS
jgi:hypothetical protein